jgi:predicted transposase YbfD/YdcC
MEERRVEVYDDLTGIDIDWIGLKSIIKVTRKVKHRDKATEETAYFISSLPATTTAKVFNEGIRSHWSIENSLHYVKDVTFREDASKIRTGNAPQNLSVVRNIVINIFRGHGYENIVQGVRLVANDIMKIWGLILE